MLVVTHVHFTFYISVLIDIGLSLLFHFLLIHSTDPKSGSQDDSMEDKEEELVLHGKEIAMRGGMAHTE